MTRGRWKVLFMIAVPAIPVMRKTVDTILLYPMKKTGSLHYTAILRNIGSNKGATSLSNVPWLHRGALFQARWFCDNRRNRPERRRRWQLSGDMDSQTLRNTIIDRILPRVQTPGQYIGGEWNSVRKDPGGVRGKLCLAFPDTYSIGMSCCGLQVLYAIMNRRGDWRCQRVFAPLADMEALLRERHLPLCSLEDFTPWPSSTCWASPCNTTSAIRTCWPCSTWRASRWPPPSATAGIRW